MLSLLLGLIPGAFSTVNGITAAISNERIKKITAKTEEERIAADENVKVLYARRDVLLSAQARSKFPIIVQSLLGVCGLVILAKLAIWDKVIGSFAGCAREIGRVPGCETFSTDPLGTDLTMLVGAVVAFYLVTSTRLFNK